MFPCCEPSYYLTQFPRYGQVLTGALPYNRNDSFYISYDIRNGRRPSRPILLTWSNRWPRGPVWEVITAGWRHIPEERCELSDMYHVFLTSSQQEIQRVKPGDLNENIIMTERSQMSKQSDSNLGRSFHGSLLSSSFCRIRSQKSRGVSMKWTR